MTAALTVKLMGRRKTDHRSDDQLMIAYGRHDRTAFEELYARYRQPLWGYLLKNCQDEAAAGEMFQDVWLRVISSSKRYQGKGKFRSWLFTLAHNRLVDFYRTPPLQCMDDTEEALVVEQPVEGSVGEEERKVQVEELVKKLPFDQRQAFYLREECGFSVKEIAEIQGVGVEAAKSRLRYAYGNLRESLEELE